MDELPESLDDDPESELDSDDLPFGTWAVSISRPGADLDEIIALLRSAPCRFVSFD